MLRNLFPEKHDKYVIKTFSKKCILLFLKLWDVNVNTETKA